MFGKSSLLNELVGEKAAKVSSTPGRTPGRLIFCVAGSEPETEDGVGGIRRDMVTQRFRMISAGWASLWILFLSCDRSTLKLCMCLVDSNAPPKESDAELFDWLRGAERQFVVVATKIDRLSGNERTRNLLALKKGLGLHEVLPVSAKTGYDDHYQVTGKDKREHRIGMRMVFDLGSGIATSSPM